MQNMLEREAISTKKNSHIKWLCSYAKYQVSGTSHKNSIRYFGREGGHCGWDI